MYFCIDTEGSVASGKTLQECWEDAEYNVIAYSDDDELAIHPDLKFYKAEQITVNLIPEKTIPSKLVEVKKPAKRK